MKPGDVLLYKPKGFYGWLISIKTWHAVAHVEVYAGGGKSVASRDGIGVGLYGVRYSELLEIRRPTFVSPFARFDNDRARLIFDRKYRGQGYDYLGLLRFAWRSRFVPDSFDNRQFCSEVATRYLRDGWPKGEPDLFGGEDADAIAPFQFQLTPMLPLVEGEIAQFVSV